MCSKICNKCLNTPCNFEKSASMSPMIFFAVNLGSNRLHSQKLNVPLGNLNLLNS